MLKVFSAPERFTLKPGRSIDRPVESLLERRRRGDREALFGQCPTANQAPQRRLPPGIPPGFPLAGLRSPPLWWGSGFGECPGEVADRLHVFTFFAQHSQKRIQISKVLNLRSRRRCVLTVLVCDDCPDTAGLLTGLVILQIQYRFTVRTVGHTRARIDFASLLCSE